MEVTKENKDLDREEAKEIAKCRIAKRSEKEWALLLAVQNVYGGGR